MSTEQTPSPIVLNVNSAISRSKADEMAEALEQQPTWTRVFHFMTDGMMLTTFKSGRMFVFSDNSMLIDPYDGDRSAFPSLELANDFLEVERDKGNPLAIEILEEAARRTALLQKYQAAYMRQMTQGG